MASDVDIGNLALGHIGNASNISSIVPGDGSLAADLISRFYPVARDEVLEAHSWGFATRRATLALLTQVPPAPWAYAYAPPADCLRPVSIPQPTSAATVVFTDTPSTFDLFAAQEAKSADYIYEALDDGSRVIYTNAPTAVLKYTARVTDTTKFTPMFATAFSYLLASYLAGPIVKGSAGVKMAAGMRQMFANVLAAARASDANTRQADAYKDFVPQHISVR